jgi:hypothetical protein
MELTETEKKALRSVGKKAYANMVSTVGEKKLKAIARAQGHHGQKGGRPKLYPKPCPHYTNGRHKFFHNDRCKCGQERKHSKAG